MKLISRLIGWALVLVAILMASGEAVLALGTGSYDGIATGEVLTLLAGSNPAFSDANGGGVFSRLLLDLPAWLAMAILGTLLIVTCRKRRHRFVCRERRLG
ncbi:hypothetical protein [Roseospirillum parvum]|uniref:Uncharacterized protein n=1 Tax=Roseospirillum parvum TaxID=83401 RepID=A0A1G8BJY1_9PROT|nr:hypothetical protein [Roseospirillum parvum]SDH33458.1 hypothetical protein SAMN05421742_10655 [Roseospirillum parvum]